MLYLVWLSWVHWKKILIKQYWHDNCSLQVLPEPQPWTAVPKKSWQQLFTRSSPAPQSSNSNVICRPNSKIQAEVKSPQLSAQSPVTQSFTNPIQFGLPSPFNISTHASGPTSSSLGFSPAIERFFFTIVRHLTIWLSECHGVSFLSYLLWL